MNQLFQKLLATAGVPGGKSGTAAVFTLKAALFALVLCTITLSTSGQNRGKNIVIQVEDSTYRLDSVPFLNPRGKRIIGQRRERHQARLYRTQKGRGFFYLDEAGLATGQTDSSEIDRGRRRKRRRAAQDERTIEVQAPEMIPFEKLPGDPTEPEMGALTPSNDGFAEIDVVVSYRAYTASKLTPDQYITAFALRFAIVAQMHSNGGNRIRLRNIKVNVSPDNYTGAGSNARMSRLRLDYPNHTAHNLMLIDNEPGNGGVAWLGTVCSSAYGSYRYSYCSVTLGTAPMGKYSYDTYCMAHELGHAFGLNHGFWCGWQLPNGTTGAVDSTYAAEGFNGVKCFSGTKNSKLGEVMGYLQLWGTPENPHFDVVTSRKLAANYQAALASGCITGGTTTPPSPVAQDGVPGAVLYSVRSGKAWFTVPVATDATDWLYEVSMCSYGGKNPPDSISKPKACSIRNLLNFTRPTAAQIAAGKIDLVANPQPATRGLWYKVQVRYRKGTGGVIAVKNSVWSVW